MLNFVLSKLRKKKWMVISLLIGNLLMVAIASLGPMYSEAILWKTLTKSLNNYYVEKNKYPGTISVVNTRDDVENQQYLEQKVEEMIQDLDVPVVEKISRYYKSGVKAVPSVVIEGKKSEISINLESFSKLEDHIEIIKGEMYSNELDDHVIEVIVNEKTYVEKNFYIGEEFELSSYKDSSDVPYRIRITGIFKNADSQDLYWVNSPNTSSNTCLMDQELYQEVFMNSHHENKTTSASWYVILDYTEITGSQAQRVYNEIAKYNKIFSEKQVSIFEVNFLKTLKEFLPDAQKLNVTIIVLQLPILVLLMAFIFMVSRQMLEMEQNEIAVYKSRGAGKKHILKIYLLQSSIIAGTALIGGVPLGVILCYILGSSSSFLEFVHRSALPIKIGFNALAMAGLAALFSIFTMVLPAFRYAKVNIVMHKRKKSRMTNTAWWKKIFLDVILLGVSLYGFYHYNQQKEFLAQEVLEGASLDPLLYLSSSMFIIGAALFVFRVFPWFIRLVFQIGKRWWAPSTYASFLKMIRTESNQGFIMVFLILTVALGIFNAQTARTINTAEEEKTQYNIGADVVIEESWESNAEDVSKGLADKLIYKEPAYEKYWDLDGIESMTKVWVDKKTKVSVTGGKITDALLMGINTKEFGETAYFKESLLSIHWYHYLNAMSQNTEAILVSSNFEERYGYAIGDVLSYENANGQTETGVIYGFVDYWPSYSPSEWIKNSEGVYEESEKFLIVAHLTHLQNNWGITPYQIWIKNKESSQYLYDYAKEKEVYFYTFVDAQAQIIEAKNNPVFQGTNGLLTVGFIGILTLCIIGFLIYWILSIQSRTLQFGIFRAMGMSKKEVWIMLILEQFFVTGISIISGIFVGEIASDLFVPLIRMGYASSELVLPLEIVSTAGDYVRVLGVIGFAIMFCMVIIGKQISKIKISQALKLGED